MARNPARPPRRVPWPKETKQAVLAALRTLPPDVPWADVAAQYRVPKTTVRQWAHHDPIVRALPRPGRAPRTYTAATKQALVRWYEGDVTRTVRQAAERFHVNHNTAAGWVKHVARSRGTARNPDVVLRTRRAVAEVRRYGALGRGTLREIAARYDISVSTLSLALSKTGERTPRSAYRWSVQRVRDEHAVLAHVLRRAVDAGIVDPSVQAQARALLTELGPSYDTARRVHPAPAHVRAVLSTDALTALHAHAAATCTEAYAHG